MESIKQQLEAAKKELEFEISRDPDELGLSVKANRERIAGLKFKVRELEDKLEDLTGRRG